MILNSYQTKNQKCAWKFEDNISIRIFKFTSNKLFKVEAYKNNESLELIYVNSGNLSIFNKGKSFKACAGDLIVFPPESVRSFNNEEDLNTQFYFISVEGLFLEMNLEQDIILKTQFDSRPIAELSCEILFQTILFSQYKPIDIAESALYILGCLFKDNFKKPNKDRKKLFYSNDTVLSKRILSYIDANYMNPLTIKNIADHFFVSPSYMSHLMKREIGYSPIDYLIRRRIGESQQLLLYTDLRISDISKKVGYTNFNNFSYLFKKHIDMSPDKFRQSIRDLII